MEEKIIAIKLPDWKSILLNIIGSSMLAFGVCAFIMPYNLIVGGATGISLIVHRLTSIPVSLIAMIINVVVLPIGYVMGGKKLVAGSVLSSLVYPMALAVFERIPNLSNIADSVILAALFGGIVCGAGIGLVMKSGGSTGGVDIPVILISKILHVPVATVMNMTDTCIMLGQIPISGVTNILYGIVYTYIMTHALDTFLTWGEERMRITVVSEQYEQIRWALIENDFGVTMVYAESGYTKTPIQKVESVMRSSDCRKAQQIIESVDPVAFITIEKVKDVRGRGYTLDREFLDF